jgi:hypothetical protein
MAAVVVHMTSLVQWYGTQVVAVVVATAVNERVMVMQVVDAVLARLHNMLITVIQHNQ